METVELLTCEMNKKSNGTTAGTKLKNGDRKCGKNAITHHTIKSAKGKPKKKMHSSEDMVLSTIFEKLTLYTRNVNENLEQIKNLTGRLLNYLKNLEVPKKINEGWPLLITILKTTDDPETIRNIVQIINNQLTSRQGYRTVTAILLNHDVISALLEALHVANGIGDREILMLEIHALIANLATKDPDFPFKVRKSGSMKLTIALIRIYTEKLLQLRPLLLVLKYATADCSSTSFYGKQGVISLLLNLANSLTRSHSTTLKLVLEILAQLTKSKYNVREVVAQSGVRILFNQLGVWEKTDGLNKLKILKAVLTCLNNLTELKIGRSAIYDVEGLGHMYRFCHGVPLLSDYDPILSLATNVAHRCLPPKWLPIEKGYGAVTFHLPSHIPRNNCQDKNDYIDDDYDATASSSDESEMNADGTNLDAVCRENVNPIKALTTEEATFFHSLLPEIQLKDEIKEKLCDKDKLVDHYRRSLDSPLKPDDYLTYSNLPDILSCFSLSKKHKPTSSIYSQPTSKRGSFETDFKFNPSSDSGSCPVISNPNECDFQFYDEKRRAESFWKYFKLEDVQKRSFENTKHVAPFVKFAYPELTADKYFANLEPLHQKSYQLCREKLLQNLDSLYGGTVSKKVVYDYDALVTSVKVPVNPLTNDDVDQLGRADDFSGILHFESRFECGNLRKAIMLGSHEYELILNPDINSDHHHQWFYFQVSNMEAGVPYSFYITNCEKTSSQFNCGMKPLLYSVREATLGRAHWVRSGRDICYFRNYYSCPPGAKGSTYFTTHFSITFQHPKDVCYIAYHYPYSYSLLQTHLFEWENCHDKSLIYYRQQTLCKTLGGNDVPILTITSRSVDNLEKRPVIFLTGRVHPGETNASWVMKGTLDFLLSDRPSAESVRETFVFKIVPMLNPDGVINGCHRCSLVGMDLNRCWLDPNKNIQPTIYYTKRLIYYLKSISRLPLVYCDFHGHSRRKNIFVYGCNSKLSWLPQDRLKSDNKSEILPRLLYHLAPAFSLNNCCFTIEQSRESTARVTLWREMDVKFSYTMESSYCGCDQGPYKDCHLGIQQLREMGVKLCQAILHLNAKTSISGKVEASFSKKCDSSNDHLDSSEENDEFENDLSSIQQI